MKSAKNGTLVIIGGREDKEKEMKILREFVELVDGGKVCVVTVASTVGEVLWEEYERLFKQLGVKEVSHLGFLNRQEMKSNDAKDALEDAVGVYFTGGDQLKITSEIGGTKVEQRIREIYRNGGVIAGTSAGASVMSDIMLVSGAGVSSYRIGGGLRMAPGLGFLSNVLIDQHFTERGRIGRLLGALAHNPKYLGIGLDENTGIVVNVGNDFRVIGDGGVYVVDAHLASDSNISDADTDTALSLFNVKVHLLSEGNVFNFNSRTPTSPRMQAKEAKAEERQESSDAGGEISIAKTRPPKSKSKSQEKDGKTPRSDKGRPGGARAH